MADFTPRSINEIFIEILNEKANYSVLDTLQSGSISDEQTFLDTLSSDSNVSIWINWAYLMARTQWATDQIMLTQVNELETIRDNSFIGNLDWYGYIALQWQYGDILIIDPDTFTISYSVNDDSKKLVGSVATDEVGGKVLLKIRGKNSDLLTTDELTSFSAYMNKVKFAGTKIIIKNSEPDKLKILADVIYNGEAVLNETKVNVETAINNYIQNLPFNSEFNKNELIDEIQAIDGIVDFRINTLEGRLYNGNFSSIVHTYKADAGYMSIDTDFPLTATLTYKIG